MKRYEAMFLFDNATMHQWSEMEGEVKRLFERIEAKPLVCVKFDERKLAYEIRGRKRGTYVLTYFEADPQRIADLERDARLSEAILRVLVLRAEKLSEEKLAQLQAHPAEQPIQPSSSEGRRGDGDRRRSRGGETPAAETTAAASTATATAVAEAPKSAEQPAPETAAAPGSTGEPAAGAEASAAPGGE